MKSSKNRRADQVVGRGQKARTGFTGAWRCRPCEGDYTSPCPKAHQKGREDKKTQKHDIRKDSLFIKPSQPTPAREDHHPAIEWRQEGHAKKKERGDSHSHRGKIDGQLQPASQHDQDELKLPDHGKVESLEEPARQDQEKLNLPDHGKVGSLEERSAFSLRQRGHSKAESLDLFELAHNPTVLEESATNGIKSQVSTQNSYRGESDTDSNTVHSANDLLGGRKDSQQKDPISGISEGEEEHLATLNSDSGGLDSVRKEGSAAGKTGFNTNIHHSESYSLRWGEDEQVKAAEETESPVSVLQGISESETLKAESGKAQAGKHNNSTQSAQGVAAVELQPLRRPDSSKDCDPASNHTHSCAGSKLVAEKLECPFDNFQTNSGEFFETTESGRVIGSPQSDYDNSLHQGAALKSSEGTETLQQVIKGEMERLEHVVKDGTQHLEKVMKDGTQQLEQAVKDGTEHSERHFNYQPQKVFGESSKLSRGSEKLAEKEMGSIHSNDKTFAEEKNPETQISDKSSGSHSVHGGEEEHLESPGNYHSMGSQSSDLNREARQELHAPYVECDNVHNAGNDKMQAVGEIDPSNQLAIIDQSSGFGDDGKELVTPKTEGESPHNAEDEKVEASGGPGPNYSLIGGKDHDSQHLGDFSRADSSKDGIEHQKGPADYERDTLNSAQRLQVVEGGEKTKDGLHEKQFGGLEDLQHDESFPKSESLEELLAAETSSLHGTLAAASIHGTGYLRYFTVIGLALVVAVIYLHFRQTLW